MSWQPIREHDSNGMLVGAGFAWWEEKPSTFAPLVLLILLAALVMFLDIFVFVFGAWLMGTVILAVCALVMGLSFWAMPRVANFRRALIFHADGRITTPNGLPGRSKWRMLAYKPADVASIEEQPERSVVLITRAGVTIKIAHKFRADEGEGRYIAVQLTTALTELRAAAGSAQKAASSQSIIE